MPNRINRDWRNWKEESQDKSSKARPSSGSGLVQSLGVESSNDGMKHGVDKATKPMVSVKKAKKQIDTSIKKLPNNYVKSISSQNIRLNSGNQRFNAKKYKFIADEHSSSHVLDRKQRHEDYIDWSKSEVIQRLQNTGKASSNIDRAELTKDKRLASALATMISKFAEDKSGEPIIGEDEWDVQELMMRSITRRNIYSCMQSRERERIILVLDSSPSCSRESVFYSKMAYLSCKLGNMEVYLAPNAHITHKINPRTGEFERVFEDDDDRITCDLDRLSEFFNNRVILFFGDFDGLEHISKCSEKNEVYWMHNDLDRNDFDLYMEEYECKFYGTVFNVRTREDLINVIRKLR